MHANRYLALIIEYSLKKKFKIVLWITGEKEIVVSSGKAKNAMSRVGQQAG